MSDDEGPMPMPMPAPKRRRTMDPAHELALLDELPKGEMYEKSYMHRDVVSHVAFSASTQFLITASADGHVKFWRKMVTGIEFVKHYKAHLQAIVGLAVSPDGLRLATTSLDGTIKFFDILGFDMVHMITLDFVPSICCWAYMKGQIVPKIVIAEKDAATLRIYHAEATSNALLHTLDKLHMAPVTVLGYNPVLNCVISGDRKGMLEYWSPDTYAVPAKAKNGISFKFKSETDLYELAKNKTYACSIDIAINGKDFVVTGEDCCIRVFRCATGKLRRKYDESLAIFEDAQAAGSLQLDAIDFGRRVAVEKEVIASPQVSNCIFDESGHFILFPTLLGIKIINIETNKLARVLGKVENTERFMHLCLFQGTPNVNTQFQKHASTQAAKKLVMSDPKAKNETDPTVFTTAFKKSRFYCFSSREPVEDDGTEDSGRDVFNEKPTLDAGHIATESTSSKLGSRAVIHTTMGDIFLTLYPNETPRTVENFCTHARNGYYDNCLFHRVIKNFMIQTGDPLGDGTGGESIWGGEFEDEFNRNLRHDRPYTLSMANAGPRTNGSQFFITTVPTPWLDNKHTVFGRVETGKDTVSNIENIEVDEYDKPVEDIRIINIDIL
ncbi:peptidylprolyl isomerase domain and WD repeat-containing protein 1 [Thraustotheca clavata]|uniref:peptidylprolyl isomerase n=1 Tax=Thraustotheca clavata TaxID=74557 RepID=A0A1V9YXM5_9STRA|nr:peptidylprolyl isomerase domain and WD repeat-containing protein 1 [Thraustotheca clavata]